MKGNSTQILIRWASGIFMMLVLLWLTVSTPFVSSFQQQMAAREKTEKEKSGKGGTEKSSDECNPFANTTEEKTESGSTSFSEEYLHHHDDAIHTIDDLLKHDNCRHSALYIAFHGELLSPPPEM